jgi:hypothetical protein
MAEKAGTWVGLRLWYRERVESGGLYVYVWRATAAGISLRVADWRAGASGIPGLNQAIGSVRAFGGVIWIGKGDEVGMAREQASGEQRAGALFTGALPRK